jgi:hypothetical protein
VARTFCGGRDRELEIDLPTEPETNPVASDGSNDLKAITAIVIVAVEDYH